MNPPVQHSMKSFLNPYIAKFIVVFNYVCLPAWWRYYPRCIYLLSDAPPNNSVIPWGPTTQTAETTISFTSTPPPAQPQRQGQPLSPPYSPDYILLLFFSSPATTPMCLPHLLHPHPFPSANSHIWERLSV